MCGITPTHKKGYIKDEVINRNINTIVTWTPSVLELFLWNQNGDYVGDNLAIVHITIRPSTKLLVIPKQNNTKSNEHVDPMIYKGNSGKYLVVMVKWLVYKRKTLLCSTAHL